MPCDNSAGSPTPTSFSALTRSTYSLPATRRITRNSLPVSPVVPTAIKSHQIKSFLCLVDRRSKPLLAYTRSPAVAKVGQSATVPYQRQTSGHRKKNDFPKWLHSHAHYGDAAISNVTNKARIWYGNSAHADNVCSQKLCIRNWGQTAADRNTVYIGSLYRNFSSPYLTVSSPPVRRTV